MLTTVTGVYENGQIVLDEAPQFTQQKKVIVTFLEENAHKTPKKRIIGSMAGKMNVPDNFDEPLEDLNEYMY